VKKIFQAIGILLLAILLGVLGVLGLIAVIEFVRHRSEREVDGMVKELPPGTSFSIAIKRLGKPWETRTNIAEVVWWTEKLGLHVEPQVATNSLVHTFVHRGPPFRYILIYTDRAAEKITHSEWCAM
jgi:hypothetical protein